MDLPLVRILAVVTVHGEDLGRIRNCFSDTPSGGSLALKIAWSTVFGRLGSIGGPGADPEDPADPEIQVVDVKDEDGEEEWEDLDSNKERAAEIERRKRILKGQIARAAARERELVPLEDCMPRNEPSVDPVGTQRQARRTSLGHATKTPSGKQSQALIGLKRKINAEEAPQKGRRLSLIHI